MTTTELENKLKISENTCIHCPTLELAKQVLNIFHQLGLKWCNEKHYITYNNWDTWKENTIYYPFEGEFTSLNYARLIDYKIIRAEEFIALHTEAKEFDLENYEPKGDLKGFPKEIISRMLDCQQEQGNPINVTVFEREVFARQCGGGFTWNETKEGWEFWYKVISYKNFNLFFERHPKKDNQESKTAKYTQVDNNVILSDTTYTQSSVEINTTEDNSQKFKVGDKVVDIITGRIGKIFRISIKDNSILPIYVDFNDGENYTLDGRYYFNDNYPRLLHYRDDYDYSIINFNNLPKRKEAKRWRAGKDRRYYFICYQVEGWHYASPTIENNSYYDNINYNSGNYFRTEVEAEIIAQKLNENFKQLIQEEHENDRK